MTTVRNPSPTRGITPSDVDRAADTLLREGERPTIEKVRQKIGRGSPNTINPLLDQWWQRLAARLDAGPAALHRIPEPVAQAAEALWLSALAESRRRVQAESGSARSALVRERRELEIHGYVLSIREAELQDRIATAEQRGSHLEAEVEALTTILRKEQASRLAAERHLAAKKKAPTAKTKATARRAKQPAAVRQRKAPAGTRRHKASAPARRRNPTVSGRGRRGATAANRTRKRR